MTSLAAASAARTILCVDMDYFFAQCEERRNPSLRNRPVVVCVYSGRTGTSGVVSTANYAARGLGVKSGTSIGQAQRLLSRDDTAVFLPIDHRYYEEVSGRIMGQLRRHADKFAPVSVDEAYLDVTARTAAKFQEASELARQLKAEVLAREHLTCSVGLASNKLVAKMAADFAKPDGLTVIAPDEVHSFLAPLPVDRLLGVGPKSARRLRELGIVTIGGLADSDVARLERTFGRQFGRYLHRAAHGLDDKPVGAAEGREQISRIATLKENSRDTRVILPVLEQLAREVYEQARHEGLAFRSLSVLAFMEDISLRTRSTTWERPVAQLAALVGEIPELLQTLLDEVPALQVRRVGARVGDLTPRAPERALTDFLTPSS